MLTIAKLFGHSPFAPLQKHLEKVKTCIDQLPLLIGLLKTKDLKKIENIAIKICSNFRNKLDSEFIIGKYV